MCQHGCCLLLLLLLLQADNNANESAYGPSEPVRRVPAMNFNFILEKSSYFLLRPDGSLSETR